MGGRRRGFWEGWTDWLTGEGRGLQSPQTITLSPRGASGGFSVFTVLLFRDVNCGSRPVMTEWGGNISGHLLSVLQFGVHIIFICLLTVMGQSVFHVSIFKLEG